MTSRSRCTSNSTTTTTPPSRSPRYPRLRVHWVARRDDSSLAEAIEARDWSDWYAWATPEAATLKNVRKRLRDAFGFPKSEVHAQAYWSASREMDTSRGGEEKTIPGEGETVAAQAETPMPVPTPATEVPANRGRWCAQAAGRLLAPMRSALVVSGVLQAVITLVQLAPFVLLVELARLLVSGADATRLWHVGTAAVALLGLGTVLGTALTPWLHVIDARFASDLRSRLLSKLSRLHRPRIGLDQAAGADDTLSLHYLFTHAIRTRSTRSSPRC